LVHSRRQSGEFEQTDPSLLPLIGRNQDLMDKLTANMMESKKVEDVKRKRDDVNYQPQEPVCFIDESYNVKDDGHRFIAFKLRAMLRPIVLHLEHIMPGGVNEATICKSQDRCAFVELKNFLGKNSGVTEHNKKKVSISNEDDHFAIEVETKWEIANTVWECVDGFLRFMTVQHLVHQHSCCLLAIFLCIHSCRRGAGCSSVR
jgi:hypothetical protein